MELLHGRRKLGKIVASECDFPYLDYMADPCLLDPSDFPPVFKEYGVNRVLYDDSISLVQ